MSPIKVLAFGALLTGLAAAGQAAAATPVESITAICVLERTRGGEAEAERKCSCEVTDMASKLDAETLRVFGITAEVALALPEGHDAEALMNGVKARGVTDQQFAAASQAWEPALAAASATCGT